MSANLVSALLLLVQGMAGIFTVLGIIALTVALLSHLDGKKAAGQQKNNSGHTFE